MCDLRAASSDSLQLIYLVTGEVFFLVTERLCMSRGKKAVTVGAYGSRNPVYQREGCV